MEGLYAPFDPSPLRVMDLAFGAIRPPLCATDVFVDLGAGDGRVVAGAARQCGEAIGVEVDEPTLDRARAELEGVDNATMVAMDMRNHEDIVPLLCRASVVYLYLSPEGAAGVLDLLNLADRQCGLRHDLRVIAIDFPLPLPSEPSSDAETLPLTEQGSEREEGSEWETRLEEATPVCSAIGMYIHTYRIKA